jgi:hypothetical protein
MTISEQQNPDEAKGVSGRHHPSADLSKTIESFRILHRPPVFPSCQNLPDPHEKWVEDPLVFFRLGTAGLSEPAGSS